MVGQHPMLRHVASQSCPAHEGTTTLTHDTPGARVKGAVEGTLGVPSHDATLSSLPSMSISSEQCVEQDVPGVQQLLSTHTLLMTVKLHEGTTMCAHVALLGALEGASVLSVDGTPVLGSSTGALEGWREGDVVALAGVGEWVVVGAAVPDVGAAVVGLAVAVGDAVVAVGTTVVVGLAVEGLAVVGAEVVGALVVGDDVTAFFLVGAAAVGWSAPLLARASANIARTRMVRRGIIRGCVWGRVAKRSLFECEFGALTPTTTTRPPPRPPRPTTPPTWPQHRST